MTTRYVGPGGNDANSGLTWALRKLTLNGVEDTPVVAGDFVWVGAGTYRELLTVDVSGTAGNPITYAGDYTGANTDGVGGVVRITGSADDIATTRANCISAATKSYRTFQGFVLDVTSTSVVSLAASCTDIIISNCIVQHGGNAGVVSSGVTQARVTIQNCLFMGARNMIGASFTHTAVVDNAAHLIQNCIFIGPVTSSGIQTTRVGGIAVKNCALWGGAQAVLVATALTVGQTVTVNNCLIQSCTTGLQGTIAGEIVEDYNAFFGNSTNRTNTNTGANSNAYPALFDPRWFFQLAYAGAGPNSMLQVVSPFDLASYSALLNVAGTSPPTTDLRGTAVQGAQREWGPLEADSTLKLRGGIRKGRIQVGS